MGSIEKSTRTAANGLKWYMDSFYDDNGEIEAVRLYDPEGWFVAEFWSKEDAERFVDRVALG